MPGCDEQTARQIGDACSARCNACASRRASTASGITVSQGLTSSRPHDEGLGALYSRADAAMYSAKRQGKDCIVVG